MPRLEKWPMTFIEEFPGMPWALGIGSRQLLDSLPLRSHIHRGHELTFILDGEVSWETESGELIDLRGGMMGLTQPEVRHHGQMDVIRPCRIVWFIVDLPKHESEAMRALDEVLKKAGNSGRQAGARLKELLLELKDALDDYAADRKSPMKALRLKCALDHALALAAQSFEKSAQRGDDSGRLTAIAEKLVLRNLRERVPLERMAEEAGVSVARFSSTFKEESGLTPADFALRLRCAKAMELLKEGGTPVTRIAYMLGFSSSQHFSRAFRRYFGSAPGSFRDGKGKAAPG